MRRGARTSASFCLAEHQLCSVVAAEPLLLHYGALELSHTNVHPLEDDGVRRRGAAERATRADQRAAYRLRAPASASPLEAVVDPRSHGRRNAARKATQTRGKPTAAPEKRGAQQTRSAIPQAYASRRGAHSTQKPCRINNGAHKRSSLAPTARCPPTHSNAAQPRRSGPETEARPVFYAPVRRGRVAEARSPSPSRREGAATAAPHSLTVLLPPVRQESRRRSRQARPGGGALQPPHHGQRGGGGASAGHGRPFVPRRVAPGVRLQDAAEHGLERRPGACTACEGCGGSARPDAAPCAGARRVRHGHHQAHRSRETPRPDRRVRLDTRHGGSPR